MKIAVIGAGLSGLSAAIAIRRFVKTAGDDLALEIKVYEVPDESGGSQKPGVQLVKRKLGVGLGLQSNGLRVLERLNPNLKDKVYASGFPCDHFKWKTAGDLLLAREYVDVLPISRPLLIDCLEECLPADTIQRRKISEVSPREGRRPIIKFEDGSPDETVDLVVGADGIRSAVRQALFADGERYQPEYLGICAVGGVLDITLPQHLLQDPSMIFCMGSTGAFGYTGLTQADKNKLLYWSVYSTPLPQRGLKFDHDTLLEQLRERHGHWTDPLIGKCLQKSNLENIYPVFVMPDLPQWGRDGCVLIGDAAHALPPRSGQGASQALEDGLTLALLLAANRKTHDVADSVSLTISDLYNVRHARVEKIRAKAMAWKDPSMPMSWWKTIAMYTFVFLYAHTQDVVRRLGSEFDWDATEIVEEYLAGRPG